MVGDSKLPCGTPLRRMKLVRVYFCISMAAGLLSKKLLSNLIINVNKPVSINLNFKPLFQTLSKASVHLSELCNIFPYYIGRVIFLSLCVSILCLSPYLL